MKFFAFAVLLALSFSLSAQDKYWVYLTDKDSTDFNPYSYFDDKAIERRIRNDIPIFQLSDAPVNSGYLSEIQTVVDSVKFASRWFNAVCVYANESQIESLQNEKFVLKIEKIEKSVCKYAAKNEFSDSFSDLDLMRGQISSLEGHLFYDAGYRGKGVRVAIFDGGFPNVDKLDCFKHVRDNGRIVKTFDFTKNKENVYRGSSHGTTVMSCIGGIYNDSLIGLATDAEFLLAITEVNPEPFSEEENWLAALEWADKNGADIVNSSLGYTFHRYFPYQMDGKTAFVSRAASMAASKGILVVNAAGNEGDSDWKYVGAPADADSILSVGGVDHDNNLHIEFSSYGPTADGRLKPNVCAYGNVYACGKNSMKNCFGTSFASPLVAGFAACALQTNPELKTMELFDEIQKSGSLYPYYDYVHGYGIPKASYFLKIEKKMTPTYISFDEVSQGVNVQISTDQESFTHDYVYIHLSDSMGKLKWYKVLAIDESESIIVDKNDMSKGDVIMVHCNGITAKFENNK